MLDTLKKHALRLLNVCLIAAVALLVIDVLLGVASRYLWGAQIKWTEELAGVLLIWVSYLGIAAAFEARDRYSDQSLCRRDEAENGVFHPFRHAGFHPDCF